MNRGYGFIGWVARVFLWRVQNQKNTKWFPGNSILVWVIVVCFQGQVAMQQQPTSTNLKWDADWPWGTFVPFVHRFGPIQTKAWHLFVRSIPALQFQLQLPNLLRASRIDNRYSATMDLRRDKKKAVEGLYTFHSSCGRLIGWFFKFKISRYFFPRGSNAATEWSLGPSNSIWHSEMLCYTVHEIHPTSSCFQSRVLCQI